MSVLISGPILFTYFNQGSRQLISPQAVSQGRPELKILAFVLSTFVLHLTCTEAFHCIHTYVGILCTPTRSATYSTIHLRSVDNTTLTSASQITRCLQRPGTTSCFGIRSLYRIVFAIRYHSFTFVLWCSYNSTTLRCATLYFSFGYAASPLSLFLFLHLSFVTFVSASFIQSLFVYQARADERTQIYTNTHTHTHERMNARTYQSVLVRQSS